jgi:hypothetical protein
MFDMSQAEVEIMLQHYGWAGVSEIAEDAAPEDQDSAYEVTGMWHKGYRDCVSRDNGRYRPGDPEIPFRG